MALNEQLGLIIFQTDRSTGGKIKKGGNRPTKRIGGLFQKSGMGIDSPKQRVKQMIKKIFITVLLGMVGTALMPRSANADTTSYTAGDLILGFHQVGASNDLEVDLGQASTFINAAAGSTFNVQFGLIPTGQLNAGNAVFDLNSDLTSVFGSSWNNNSQTNLVRWGIAGTDASTKVFLTFAEATPGTLVTPVSNGAGWGFVGSNFTSIKNKINNNLGLGIGGYQSQPTTNNSNVATIQSAGVFGSGNNAWQGFQDNSNGLAFGSGRIVEQPLSGSYNGPTNSTLDLFQLPNTNSAGTYVGSFSLNNSGQLQFSNVPEPSTLLVLTTGAAFLALRRRRSVRA